MRKLLASSRMRSLFLDRCQQLQDDIIRYRVMFVQNGGSAKPLQRDLKGDTLSVLMKLLVSSVDYDTILLSLRGRQAGRALEILQDVSHRWIYRALYLPQQSAYPQPRDRFYCACGRSAYVTSERSSPPLTHLAGSSCTVVRSNPSFALR